MKILLAETGERTEIFRRVFDTDIFNKITISLNNRQKEAKEKLQELRIEFATISSNTSLEEKIDSKDINELYINQILDKLKGQVEQSKEEFELANKETKKIEKEYKTFEEGLKEKLKTKSEADILQKNLNSLEKAIEQLLEKESKSKKYSKNLKLIKENLKKYNELNEKDKNLKTKLQKVKEILSLKKEYKKDVKEYDLKENEFKIASHNYLEKEDEFFREQAGILALKLEEGKPCPVCGSISHPNPASKSESVLTKNELDFLKEKLELKQKDLIEVKEKIAELNSKIKTLIDELEIDSDIEKEKESLGNALEENSVKLKEIFEIINTAYFEISEKKIDLTNFDFEEYQEEADSKILAMKEELTKTKTLKEEKEKEIKAKNKIIKNIDFEKIEEELKINKKTFEEKRELVSSLKRKLDNNKDALAKLEKISKKLIATIKEYMVLDELYRTASGTLPGKTKINFEQYIQTNYFDMVVVEANKRFMKMTDGRFQLLRKEASAKVSDKIALELEVLDYYNGKKRDVKSLSGGEAFKAALCLALGLSDIIQNYSGGVQVDTLFIDEGFGSLDTESREQAINTLNELASSDKLIGIISHVSELQDRIDKKIIVEKGTDGSKIRIEIKSII